MGLKRLVGPWGFLCTRWLSGSCCPPGAQKAISGYLRPLNCSRLRPIVWQNDPSHFLLCCSSNAIPTLRARTSQGRSFHDEEGVCGAKRIRRCRVDYRSVRAHHGCCVDIWVDVRLGSRISAAPPSHALPPDSDPDGAENDDAQNYRQCNDCGLLVPGSGLLQPGSAHGRARWGGATARLGRWAKQRGFMARSLVRYCVDSLLCKGPPSQRSPVHSDIVSLWAQSYSAAFRLYERKLTSDSIPAR